MPKNITSDALPVFETQMFPLGSIASEYGNRRFASIPYPVLGESAVPGLLEFDPASSEMV